MSKRAQATRKPHDDRSSSSRSSVVVARAGAPGARKWIAIGVAAFLLVQLLLPLRYYLSASTPDERFAWRMFSTTGQMSCEATVYQTVEHSGRRVEEQVPAIITAPWQRLLNKNRPEVVEKFMRACFKRPGVVRVRYKLECRAVDGAQMPAVQLVLDRREGTVREIESASQ
jgi:hypothetical protein